MNVLNKLTIRSLKLNKKRSLVTIIGIILSTLLITSVITLLSSFHASTLEFTKKHFGDYHLQVANVPHNDLERIQNLDNIESYFVTQNVGYSIFEYQENIFPIQVINFSDDAFQKLGIELIDGRFPQNENEIIISSQLTDIESININIGSQISLPIQSEDTIITKDYEVVGIVNIMNQQIEPLISSASNDRFYTFISYLNTDNLIGNYNIYIRYHTLSNRIETLTNILEMDDKTYQSLHADTVSETEENILSNRTNKYEISINPQLILVELGYDFDQTNQMLYTVAIIILIIIIATSAYCIKNSFNISVAEKVKQYGLLSSVGTTAKQIRRSILYEAFILGIISIPIGILLGTGLIYLFLKFISQGFSSELFGMEFIFSTNIVSIVLAIIFSALTIYLSARTPAKKASKISPIDAIKNSKDIQIKSKQIKSFKFIKRIFGVGGVIAYKNIKRNKKSYRATVVSIIMSVSMFIALFTFTNYAFEVSKLYYDDYDFNILISSDNYSSLKEIAQDSHIQQYTFRRDFTAYIENGDKHFSDDSKFIDLIHYATIPNITLTSLGDNEYQRFIKELGLEYDDVADKGILLDYITDIGKIDGKNKIATIRFYDYQEGDTLQLFLYDENKKFPIEIAAVTDKKPIGFPSWIHTGPWLIVSDETFDNFFEITDTFNPHEKCDLFIVTDNSEELISYIKQNYSDNYSHIDNIDNRNKEQTIMFTSISVFLYTFIIVTSLIGVTNIFNTITTSMELRQKEFAHLKSIGMTKKEFNRMIRLENIFLGLKALIIGVPLGIIFSYIVHIAFSTNVIMEYIFPLNGIIISVLTVFILLGLISLYSLRKINKQNIIEIIRRDNI